MSMSGFNGATPQQAWKAVAGVHSYLQKGGFNGATPQQAWKERSLVRTDSRSSPLQWGHASTGVEREMPNATIVYKPGLQWGHASTGVERRTKTAYEIVDDELQWGHASTGVERYIASDMRAIAEHSFNGATPQQAWKEQSVMQLLIDDSAASMGPRLNRRGKR